MEHFWIFDDKSSHIAKKAKKKVTAVKVTIFDANSVKLCCSLVLPQPYKPQRVRIRATRICQKQPSIINKCVAFKASKSKTL